MTTATALRDRLIGEYRGDRPGPLVFAVGGMHGNEPAGPTALAQVFARLKERRPPFRGDLVAIHGNVRALSERRRFLRVDLNRAWTEERLAALGRTSSPGDLVAEEREQKEILGVFENLLPRRRGPLLFLDLHTTSAGGVPFVIIGDSQPNRKIAFNLGIPVILGMEEHLEGTLLNYLGDLGYAGVGFEGGQHDDPAAVDNHRAAIWLTLEAAGCLSRRAMPEIDASRFHLARQGEPLPRVLEVRHHHAIPPGDRFQMNPGFVNFQPIHKGQLLAHDGNGDVRAPESGQILMPLYQAQGEDGYFLVRPVRPLWLRVAGLLRRLHLDSLVHHLPGVQPHAVRPATVVVDPHVARWWVTEIFHLLGYRRRRREGRSLIFSRRIIEKGPK